MDKRSLTKGYTVIDLLISVIIVSILGLIFLPSIELPNLDYYLLPYDIWDKQLIAMLNDEKVYLDDKYGCEGISGLYFNEKGNVNMPKTIYCNSHKYTMQLGTGRVFYE